MREGTLQAGEFPGLLRQFVSELADGRLEFISQNSTRTLWLEAGQVRAVTSDVEDEKLGRWLVARGRLDAQQMALALLRQPEGMRLGALLVQDGLADAQHLVQELEALAVCIVSHMLLTGGSYRFFPGEQLPADTAMLEMTTGMLIVGAVRSITDTAQLEKLVKSDQYLWGGQDALLRYQKLSFTPHEAYLLSRIDGTTTAGQLYRVVPLPRPELNRALASLVAAGFVEVHNERLARVLEPEVQPIEDELPVAEEAEEEGLQFTLAQQREYEEISKLAADFRHRDYYRRLGLTHGAKQDQIHERYRELARLYHPDRAREPHLRQLRRELAEIQAGLKDAYSTLMDTERRTRYDGILKASSDVTSEQFQEEERRQLARRNVAEANVRRAQELARTGDIGLAVQLLDQAIRFDPQPGALLELARLEFRNPMWSQRALDHLRRAVTVAPQFTEAWLELARFWAKRRQHDKQRQCLQRTLEYDPTNEEAAKMLSAIPLVPLKR